MGQVRHGSATIEPGTGHQPKDSGETTQAGDGRGYKDEPVGASIYCPDRGRGSDDRHIPAPHIAAAGQLTLSLAVDDPAPDRFSVALVCATAWQLWPA